MLTNYDSRRPSGARVVLMMGAPGSGKGTQGVWLSNQLGLPCVSTGEVLRAEAKRNTPSGFRLRQILASGALVSDDTVCAVVGARLRKQKYANGVILDGFPRTVAQAQFLDGLLADLGLPRPTVLHLDVSKDDLLRRLTGRRQCAACGTIYNLATKPSAKGSRCEKDGGALVQRDDDTEGVILDRFRTFESMAAPLIEYYKGAHYFRIAAGREQGAVSEEILEILTARAAVRASYQAEFAA